MDHFKKFGIPSDISSAVISDVFKFLGYIYNLSNQTIALTDSKIEKALNCLNSISLYSSLSLKSLQKCCGILVHCSCLYREIFMNLTPFYNFFTHYRESSSIFLTPSVSKVFLLLKARNSILTFLKTIQPVPFSSIVPDSHLNISAIWSDASLSDGFGCAGFLENCEGWQFPTKTANYIFDSCRIYNTSIAAHELLAVSFSLWNIFRKYPSLIKSHIVYCYIDNANVIAWCKRKRHPSISFQPFLWLIHKLAINLNCILSYVWVPSKFQLADSPSRIANLKSCLGGPSKSISFNCPQILYQNPPKQIPIFSPRTHIIDMFISDLREYI